MHVALDFLEFRRIRGVAAARTTEFVHFFIDAFDAVIHSDCTIAYTDRPGFDVDLAHGSAGFDITDMIMGSAGQDPYAAEREFFVEQADDTIRQCESRTRAEVATPSATPRTPIPSDFGAFSNRS